MTMEDENEPFFESRGVLCCKKCQQEITVNDEGHSILYTCPTHGLLLFGMSGGKADRRHHQRSPDFLADVREYTLILLEMPEGRLKTIATIASWTGKPSWLVREQCCDGQWSYPEVLTAQLLDMVPALKQRGLPFKIEPDFPWLEM